MLTKIEIRKSRSRKRKSDSWAGQNEEKPVGRDWHGRFKTKLGQRRAKCAHLCTPIPTRVDKGEE